MLEWGSGVVIPLKATAPEGEPLLQLRSCQFQRSLPPLASVVQGSNGFLVWGTLGCSTIPYLFSLTCSHFVNSSQFFQHFQSFSVCTMFPAGVLTDISKSKWDCILLYFICLSLCTAELGRGVKLGQV